MSLQSFVLLSTFLGAGAALHAQNTAPSQAPASYLHVSAPYAQQLLLEARTKHPELKKIGLHAIAPGETESAIIANPIASKIGKVSSPRDLVVVSTGKPTVTPHPEEGGFFDLGLPMTDAKGRPLGMMVMEIPYSFASTPGNALHMGEQVRDEIAARIPDKAALFQPTTQFATPAAGKGQR